MLKIADYEVLSRAFLSGANKLCNNKIILNDLKIIAGENIEKYSNKPISLYVDYRNEQSYNNQDAFSPTIHALLINQETLTSQLDLLDNQSIRWYEYVPGHPGDAYGGLSWKYINNEDNNLLLDKHTFNSNQLTTEIKALWCENLDDGMLFVLGESEPLVFKHVLSNYLNAGKDTAITIVGKTQLPVYNTNGAL